MSERALNFAARPPFLGGFLEQASTIVKRCRGRYRQQKDRRFLNEKSGFLDPSNKRNKFVSPCSTER